MGRALDLREVYLAKRETLCSMIISIEANVLNMGNE